jgi:hypothetical protein
MYVTYTGASPVSRSSSSTAEQQQQPQLLVRADLGTEHPKNQIMLKDSLSLGMLGIESTHNRP